MNSPRIAMIVDHALRDLPGLVLLARVLAKVGAKVFLVPMYAQEREVFTLKPDFVLLNYIRKNNESFVAKLKKSGIQYGILDTEGGFYGHMKSYSDVISHEADLYEGLRCNLIWGQKMMDFYQHDFPHRHPLFLTGLPRFDFYAKKFRDLNFDFLDAAYKQKPMILINTKVAIANPLFISLDKEVALYRDKLGMPEEKIQFYLKYGKLAIEDTLQLGRELSVKFPASQIIIRPHPHENHHTYEKPFLNSPYKNVEVHREGSVTPWILQSKVVVHRHCTTAIESALAGRAPIAPQWIRTSAETPDAEAVSLRPETREELNELLEAFLKGQSVPHPTYLEQELQRIVDDWLFKVDGESHTRAAQVVLENLGPVTRNDSICRELAFANFSERNDIPGRTYHFFNQVSGATNPAFLWQIEKMRLAKWAQTQKFYTPQGCLAWCQPVDYLENQKTTFQWASQAQEYDWNYPGSSVLVTSGKRN